MSRGVLHRAQRAKCAGGHGSQRALALVRALAGRVAVRTVDWERRRDPHQKGARAEDRSAGCAAVVAADDRRPFPADLGAGFGEPRPATTAVASASTGADSHAGDESAARGGAQRRTATQESAVAAGRSPGTGVVRTGSLGQPATPGLARLTRPNDAEDPGTDACVGGGSGEASGDAAADDAPGSWAADGARLRVGDWSSGTFPLRQASGQLCRTGAVGGIQWRSAATGAHQQAGQCAAPVAASRSGGSHGTKPTTVAQPILPPRDAARTEDREGSDGAEAGGTSVLDVASGPGLRPTAKARFARGSARTSRWCAVNHRRNDWASRSL